MFKLFQRPLKRRLNVVPKQPAKYLSFPMRQTLAALIQGRTLYASGVPLIGQDRTLSALHDRGLVDDNGALTAAGRRAARDLENL